MKMTSKRIFSFFLIMVLTFLFTFCGACKKKEGKKEAKTPTIMGVKDGETYYLGKDTIKPEFDVGKGTLSKDSSAAEDFISGTEIKEIGKYKLVVKNKNKTAKASFEVKEGEVEYPGEMTDMFNMSKLSDKYYISTPNLSASVTDGILTMKNGEGEPWSIMSRKFADVNATENPFVEFCVTKIGDGEGTRLEVKLSYPDKNGELVGEETVLVAEYAGTYYVDVLGYVKAKKLNKTNQELCLTLAVVGENAGYAEISIDYYRSVKEIPKAEAAGRYIDNTEESLKAWRSNTATIEVDKGKGTVYVTNSKENEEWGHILKRVQLNTADYPVLVVDIDSVHGNAQWSMKCVLNDKGEDIALTKDIAATGKTKINLLEKGIPRGKNVTVTLKFNVIKKGLENFVVVNGFSTEKETSETAAETFKEYPGEMTDMFDNRKLNDKYSLDQNLALTVKDGIVTMKNGKGDPWSMIRRTFNGVNATKYPYVEIKVPYVGDGEGTRLEVKLSYPDKNGELVGEETVLVAEYAGTYYVDVLGYVKAKKLNKTNQELCLTLAVVGKENNYAKVSIDYFKSVAKIPEKKPVGRFVDYSSNTLSTWRSNTAVIDMVNNMGKVYVTNKNPKEPYGYIVKRVELNTEDYPILVVDIDSLNCGAFWSIKAIVNDKGEDIALTKDVKATGRYEIDLIKKGIPKSKNVTVTLKFNVIGKGKDVYAMVKGFETMKPAPVDPGKDPDIVDDFSKADWSKPAANEGTVAINNKNMTLTKLAANNGWVKTSKLITVDTSAKHVLKFGISKMENARFNDESVSFAIINQNGEWVNITLFGNQVKKEERTDGGCDVYIDLQKTAVEKGLDLKKFVGKDIELFFEIGIAYGTDKKSITFDEIRLVDKMPEEPEKPNAPRYVDNTAETLAQWQNNTAKIEVVDGKGAVSVTGTDPWGFVYKTIQLNTADYPYLVVDIDAVNNVDWSLKCIVEGSAGDVTLIGDNNEVGKHEINLLDKIPSSKNLTVTLQLYAVGKGDGKNVIVKGLETNVASMKAPALDIDFSTTNGWAPNATDPNPISLTVADNKGTFTVGGTQGGYGAIIYNATLNTKDYRYIVIDVESADCDFQLQVNDGGPKYGAKELGKRYIDMQAVDANFQQGVSVDTKLTFFLVGDPGNKVVVNKIYTTNKLPDKDLIDDFSKADWNKSDATGTVEVKNNTLVIFKPSTNVGYLKANKTILVDTSEKHVIKFGIKAVSGINLDDADDRFRIEIINMNTPEGVGWVVASANIADMVVIHRADGGFDVYFDLDKMVPAEKKQYLIGKDLNLFFEIGVNHDPVDKSVTFDEIRLVDAVPGISPKPDETDGYVVDAFTTTEGWSQPTADKGSIKIENNTMTLVKAASNSDFAKTNKFFTLNTSEKHVVKFGISDFKANWDGGFTIEILNQNGEWVGFKIEGQNLCKFERADGGYDVYFDLKALAAEKGVSEEKFIGNDLKLFFEIGVGFGAEKSVTFDGIALVDAVPGISPEPDKTDGYVVDAFTTTEGWSQPTADKGSIKIENNTMTLVKAASNSDFAKTNKFFTLNTSEKHVVKFGISDFKANWDGGFTIEILNQNGEWVGFKIEGQNLCKFERADGGYDVYFDLKALAAEKGVSEEKFIGNDLKLFFEIGVGFGAEKSVTFDGIALVDAVPAN